LLLKIAKLTIGNRFSEKRNRRYESSQTITDRKGQKDFRIGGRTLQSPVKINKNQSLIVLETLLIARFSS
jgi:hypothetical protein